MEWTPVEFSLVRYSPIEGTHFFYDERYPSSIQFLLSGRWESWDVGWVKYKAQDPEIRWIAAEAEARLIQEPRAGYVHWPTQPPPGPPSSTQSDNHRDAPMNGYQTHQHSPADAQPSPLSAHSGSVDSQSALPSRTTHDQPPVLVPSGSYTSPYAPQTSSVGSPAQPQVPTPMDSHASARLQAPPVHIATNGVAKSSRSIHPAPTPSSHSQAVVPQVVLSRNRETKILLSLDGDGIRGLSTLLLVESLVNAICVKLGQRLDPHQIFDLTGGSSLGGAIAIMLCRLQMQAHRAREAYKQIASQAYLNKRDFFLSRDPTTPRQHLDAAALTKAIKTVVREETGREDELLFDGRDDSGDVFVVSTHIEIGANKPALMRSYQTRRITGPELDANMTIWQAIKAACVAPRYMLPQPGVNQRLVIEPGLVDHGTAKNNPIRDILYECRKLFRYANDMMIIVSIGTGVGLNRTTEIADMATTVEDRNTEARVWGDKFEADNQALIERGWMKYFRFNVTGLEDVPLEEWRHEDLIKEKTSAYLAQPEVSTMFYACVEAITNLLLGVPQGRL